MKIKVLLFVVLCIINLTGLAQKRLQQTLAMVKNVETKTLDTLLKEQYDKNGNLIFRVQPTYYCTEEYEYDNKNRLVQQYIMCGESNGNGLTKYSYRDNKIIGIGEFGAYPFYSIEDSLDSKGRIIRHQKWQNLLDTDSAYICEETIYNKDKISKKIEHSKWFSKDEKFWEFAYIKSTEKTYFYTPFDSLESLVFTDLGTKQAIVLEKNFYNAKNQLAKTIYAYEFGESQKKYHYNTQQKLVLLTMESRKSPKNTWKLDSKTEYIYDKQQLVTEIIYSYYEGILQAKITNSYQNNMLQKSIEIDRNGKEVETTLYQYTYFDEK